MKGANTTCLNCDKSFIKKRKDHRYCQSKCRTMHYRKKNGIAEPKFLTRGVNKPLREKPTELIDTSAIEIRTSDQAILMVQQQINYYESIISDAGANVFPLWMVGLSGAGFAAGGDNLTKLALGAIGGYFGKQFDAKRKENVINTAHHNIKYLKAELRSIRGAKIAAKMSIQNGLTEVKRKGVMKVINTDDYKTKNIPSLGLNRDTQWHYLMGDPSKNFMAMLHGMPGNGKSTFSIQLADYFQKNHGNVLYIASEQKGLNRSFQDLLNQYVDSNFDIANNAKDHNYEQILKVSKDYDLVIIDSINHIGLTAIEFEKIREKSTNTAFIAIMQSKKDGDFKGTQEWAHNCDIIIEMRKMVAYQTKSRFAPPSHIKVIRES